MLTNAFDLKQHEELIIDRDALCIQIETGNPFLSDQDYTFLTKDAQERFQKSFNSLVSERIQSKEVEHFINEQLRFSQKRAERIPNNPEIINSIALSYYRIGDNEKALELFKRVLEIDKNNFSATANIARCYADKGDLDAALRMYQELEARRPKDIRVLMNTAIQFLKKKQFNESLSYFKKILKISPDYPPALNNLGLIYLRQKKIPEAINTIRKAIRVKNDDFGAYNNLGVCFAIQRSFKKAIKYFSIAYSFRSDAKDILHNLSQAYQEIGQHEKVISLLEDFLKSDIEEVGLRNMIGWSYLKLGLSEKGLRELKIALKHVDPDDYKTLSTLLNNAGVACVDLGEMNIAESYFIKSLDSYGKGARITFCNLIHLYFKLREFSKAKVYIKTALSIYPGDLLLLTFLGDYYANTNRYVDAKAIYEKVLSLHPQVLTPYIDLSTIEIDVNHNTRRALELLNTGLKEHPNSIGLINNYAYALILEGKLKEARRILDQVKDEVSVFLKATRGLLLVKEGDIHEGRRYYNSAISLANAELNKNLAALANQKKHLEIGKLFLEQGKRKEATRLLKKGLTFKTRENYYKHEIETLLGEKNISID